LPVNARLSRLWREKIKRGDSQCAVTNGAGENRKPMQHPLQVIGPVRTRGLQTIGAMVMRDMAQDLVKKLASKLNLPELELDEDGYCCVAFDGVVVNLEHEEDGHEFLLFAKVADAPADISQRYVEEILDLSYAAMLTGGGCLGLDKAGGAVMFADRISLRALDDAGFEQAVEDWVDRAEGWQKLFAGPEFARIVTDGPKLEEMSSMMRI
jgi:Tir chaperone protein (CesT) family